MANQELEVVNKEKYLGVMEINNGVIAEKSVKRAQSAIQRPNPLRAAGIHEGKILSTTMLTICQPLVQPVATYAIHLNGENRELQESLDKPEKEIIKIALGIYWERRRARLREFVKLDTLNEVKALNMTAMKRQLRKRSKIPPKNRGANRTTGCWRSQGQYCNARKT